MSIFLLSILFQVIDISGQGYTDVVWQTKVKTEAEIINSELRDCEVFTDVDTKEYSVICKDKSKTYITGVGGTHRKVD